jgi:hypothetical protein
LLTLILLNIVDNFKNYNFIIYNQYEWGLGIGDWGLGLGALAPTPNPQSPIPNPQSPIDYE